LLSTVVNSFLVIELITHCLKIRLRYELCVIIFLKNGSQEEC